MLEDEFNGKVPADFRGCLVQHHDSSRHTPSRYKVWRAFLAPQPATTSSVYCGVARL
jgi:hypothetical protein